MSGIGRAGQPGFTGVGAVDGDATDGGGSAAVAGAGAGRGTGSPVVRGTAPARPVIGGGGSSGAGAAGGAGGVSATGVAATGASSGAGARRPIEAAVYGPILTEARAADWTGAGIDPVRYVEDRLSKELFLTPLLEKSDAKVVLHRQALKIGQVASTDASRPKSVSHPDAKDFPARVYWSEAEKTFRVVGIAGEDWHRQTLHMLATAGVPASKIHTEGVFDPQAIAAKDLDATLAAYDFDSVSIGTMGELTRATERVLRERERPAFTEKVLAEMGAFLSQRAQEARPDRRARWEELSRRHVDLMAQGGAPLERLSRIEADPALSGPLGELLRKAEDGPPAKELPWRVETRNAEVFAHRIVEVDGKLHLLVHIGGAHGDMAYEALKRILSKEPTLGRVNMYGSCGSFSDALPPDTFILPSGAVRSAESDRAPVAIANAAVLAGGVSTAHSNVSTLLREHRAGLARLTGLPAETVDIESYHVARAVAEANANAGSGGSRVPPVELRTILRVSDVATSSALGAHRDDRAGTSDYDARRVGEEKVVVALGLVAGTR